MRRDDIQGLRGLAIISVLLYHYFPNYFPNGFVGVDMFFVISGYLMGMIIQHTNDRADFSLLHFYYRRVKRIIPLYYLVILCILLVLRKLPSNFEEYNLSQSWKSLGFISNIQLPSEEKMNYEIMLMDAKNLFTHTWSLSVEIQWYLIVPFLYFLQVRVTQQKSFFFFGVFLLSSTRYLMADERTSFYSVFARIWQFSCGIIAFNIYSSRVSRQKSQPGSENIKHDSSSAASSMNKNSVVLMSICVNIMASLGMTFVFYWVPLRKHWLRIQTTLATTVLTAVPLYNRNRLLTGRCIVYLGDISYALYLVHYPICALVIYYRDECKNGVYLGIFGSLALALTLHHYFEACYLTWSSVSISRTLLFLLIAIIGVSFYNESQRATRLGFSEPDYANINVDDASWNMTLMRHLNIYEGEPGRNLGSSLCNLTNRFVPEATPPYGLCTMPNGDGNHDILVLGNSFAANQAELVYKSFKRHARQFHTFAVKGCVPLIKNQPFQCDFDVNYTNILQTLKPDIIFLLCRAMGEAKDPLDAFIPIEDDKVFQENLERVLELENVAKKDLLMKKDDYFARQRLREVAKRCNRCELIDYLPKLVDGSGHYLGYNPTNNLMYLDRWNHFTRFARDRIQVVFEELSKSFSLEQLL